ncbi:Uu.00g082020.m01.CDS01 [Anthostomella pinea]|uniref:Uu.00g082020.m01.CDS01 n=1 Tax=Anthostomella pinea TaxID=933095 RepID=A0AAI8VM88_9PEZI|nr:Uu.00g082020.m01.CDS01 [Anthostomella pinea]
MGKRRKLAQPQKPAKHGGGAGGHKTQPKAATAKGKGAGHGNVKSKGQQATAPSKTTNPPAQQQQRQHAEPTIPFSPEDKILLIGEGDLSFGASLVTHHYCADVTATVLEKNRAELLLKYPHAAANIAAIEAEGDSCRVAYNVDATKMAPFTTITTTTTAGTTGTRQREGVMDRIIFNFPHVGGKSTDVNRQVRYNQELLVAFFQHAIPSLAPSSRVASSHSSHSHNPPSDDDDDSKKKTPPSIIVTLFEGEPYTLWNIRDLARHCGLQVECSFRFQAAAYPGYHHARTLGVIKNKNGDAVGGGWKGEDRAARSYVFVRKDVGAPDGQQRGKKRARAAGGESSDED